MDSPGEDLPAVTEDTDPLAARVIALHAEINATVQKIDDRVTKVRHLVDFAVTTRRLGGVGTALELIDEATDTARAITDPVDRSIALREIYRSVIR